MPSPELTLLDGRPETKKVAKVADEFGLRTFDLGNRRYLGGKSKLLEFIDGEMYSVLKRKPTSLFDVFAGTGVVANHFASQGIQVAANDLLQHNYYGLLTFMGTQRLNLSHLAEKIVYLSNLRGKKNYFSEHFSGNYFSESNAKKIGTIRDEIDDIAGGLREKAALITSLIYAADRVANTVGHYDAFHRGQNNETPLELKLPLVCDMLNPENAVYCQDSSLIASKIHAEVAYMDPPYNSRQYSDAYHLLENLSSWEKPEVLGVSKKMDRSHLKSDFCGRGASEAFESLVNELQANVLMVSYNNTSNSLNARSNAAISDADLIDILETRGKVTIREVEFNGFTTGRTKKRKHTERLFICKVTK